MEEKDISHRNARARGWPPWDYPHNFPFSVLILQHLCTHGIFCHFLADSPIVGLHPAAVHAFWCPALRPKQELGDRDKDVHGLLDKESMCPEKKGPSTTAYHVQQRAGRTWRQSSPLEGGTHQSNRELTSVCSSVTRETFVWAASM